ncbi:putative bifunctional diguanylate cyclase/phosphodiesterase [[Clostridium] polysaccharolyticum]|uniref:Diguanylate cyclase (GGDEF) domain-containing protein n=1 Tax=[Clostridium] polysaccharolyticum TaxID=29364 RepID=A0A1I0AU90_9FIRM|nr:GGDEF domain-containing phosphodiesterase [[Clostridium] polysaccharolyticum]SES97947.1 diguanylate cyclase (GGDEF) domain-containing protein [[Clostridium] polysaccharolyticum]
MYCDASYRKLLHQFIKSNCSDRNQISQFFLNNVSQIAEKLRIGRVVLNQQAVLYSVMEGCEAEEGTEFEFGLEKGEVKKISVWPVKGCVWTEEEKSNVELLAETIFIMGGYVRLLEMVCTAEVTDTLTGISNDTGIHIHAAKLHAAGKLTKYACLFINLKNFKFINKQVAFDGGNKALKQFGEAIVKMANEEDEFAGRLGGDNFFVLVKKERVNQIVEEIFCIKAFIPIKEKEVVIQMESRVGCAGIQEGEGVSDTINKASVALLFARKNGRDFMEFEPYMLDITLRAKRVSSSFNDAIAKQEFEAYYQPKVNTESLEICGTEALVRWFHNGKMIPPMEFIPILEQEGTICQLDFYMLNMACVHIRRWMDEGIEPVRVSVNFSKNHLNNPRLVKEIVAVINKNNIPPKFIEIELTEMSDYNDYKVMEDFVDQLKFHGIATSIDDFGTGSSSMTLLRDLNVDTVKLDRSFVVNLEKEEQKDRVMIESVASLVKAFGMEVLVEGVETEEQFRYLKSVGCDVIQGYFFDKPMPEKEFTRKLKEERCYIMEYAR